MKTMQQRDKELIHLIRKNSYNSGSITNTTDQLYELSSYRPIENDSGYHYEFEDEYENYNSDYDLNIK